MWQQAQDWFKRKLSAHPHVTGTSEPKPCEQPDASINVCCNQPVVHIAFRGKADDRMYIAYDRNWQEVRYYQKNGLRVFCAKCRRRLL